MLVLWILILFWCNAIVFNASRNDNKPKMSVESNWKGCYDC